MRSGRRLGSVAAKAQPTREFFWQVSGELGLALIGADSEVLSQSPEQIAEVSAEPLEYLLLRSPDLGPRFYATASWDSKTGWNNLSGGLVVSVTTGPSGSTISPHPARDIIPPLSGARASSYWIRCYIVFMLLLISAIAARTALPETERLQSERLPLRYCRRVRQRGSSAPWHAAKNHAPGYAQVASG